MTVTVRFEVTGDGGWWWVTATATATVTVTSPVTVKVTVTVTVGDSEGDDGDGVVVSRLEQTGQRARVEGERRAVVVLGLFPPWRFFHAKDKLSSHCLRPRRSATGARVAWLSRAGGGARGAGHGRSRVATAVPPPLGCPLARVTIGDVGGLLGSCFNSSIETPFRFPGPGRDLSVLRGLLMIVKELFGRKARKSQFYLFE